MFPRAIYFVKKCFGEMWKICEDDIGWSEAQQRKLLPTIFQFVTYIGYPMLYIVSSTRRTTLAGNIYTNMIKTLTTPFSGNN